MHPFLDGNGRTARALEALMRQRVGLRDTLFIAMSNYYYEEKAAYLRALAQTRAAHHDLTPFLVFALRGIETQCRRLLTEIREQVTKALFRNTMTDLFGRLKSPRKRVMTARHIQMLGLFLDEGTLTLSATRQKTEHFYRVKNPFKALVRDLNYLIGLGALASAPVKDSKEFEISIVLEWPTRITETEFFKRASEMPKWKVHGFLSR
jgi:Fic family protein